MAMTASASTGLVPCGKSVSSRRSAFRGGTRALAPSRAVRATPRSVAARAEVREIFMPALSSTMTEGKIVSWLKGEGEAISKGEAVVVVESDKADMDVETFHDGYLAVIAVADGEMATVGAPICYVAETEAEIEEAKAMAAAASSGGAAAPPAPPAPEPVAAAPAPPPPAPVAAAPVASPAPVAAAPAAAVVAGRADGRIVATPYAKKLAKKLRVDLATVAGSGLGGRITAGDVEAKAGVPSSTAAAPVAAAVAAPAAVAAAPSLAAAAPAPLPAVAGTAVPLSGMQKAVGKNMLPSLAVPVSRIAMSMCTDELDALYKKVKPKGVTMTALLAKAAGVALSQHPIMFASLTPTADAVVYNDKVNPTRDEINKTRNFKPSNLNSKHATITP